MKQVEISWIEEAERCREEFVRDTRQFLQIRSVRDCNTATELAPFGKGIDDALHFALKISEDAGFITKNLDGYAAHAELGQGDKLVGILCHVDVVPEGEGWTSLPYAAEIRDGKIFARGALDDKGPTMAAIYAAKLVKELELPLKKRVRLIFGTDEESGWKCVKHYFQQEEMPTIGFAPDADFPIIYAEKGIANFDLVTRLRDSVRPEPEASVLEMVAGERLNMVPDQCRAVLAGREPLLMRMIDSFEDYLQEYGLEGSTSRDREILTLNINGVSAHGMEPYKGLNAGLVMAHFLRGQHLDNEAARFMEFLDDYAYEDFYGENLGISYKDGISGPLTMNLGIISFQKHEESVISVNMRYPVTTDFDKTMEQLGAKVTDFGFEIKHLSNSKPHYVDKNSSLIQTLQKVYEAQTGQPAELVAIGGGTYARSLTTGVAFGPLFPGRVDTAHQRDEHIEIDDLIKAIAIYAQAIYELAKDED